MYIPELKKTLLLKKKNLSEKLSVSCNLFAGGGSSLNADCCWSSGWQWLKAGVTTATS